ncbi:MAG: transketolase family protein [Ignavibacteria bacterium]
MKTYKDILLELCLNDERCIVLTAESRKNLEGLPLILGNRFIDTGINEQTLVGTAVGLALRGRIPIVHAFASFLTMRAFEFIRTDVGYSALPVKLLGECPGILSEALGPAHQALEDIALIRGIPNINIFCPADENDLLTNIKSVIESPLPYYVRFTAHRSSLKHLPMNLKNTSEILREGTDVIVFVHSVLTEEAYYAAEILGKNELSVKVINVRQLKPIDEQFCVEQAKHSKICIAIEDHFQVGGLYTILSEIFIKHQITTELHSISLGNHWFTPLILPEILQEEGLDRKSLAERILKIARKK